MNGIVNDKSKSIFEWLNWLSIKWNNYEAFLDFQDGSNPKEVAEKFVDLNRIEFLHLFESLDKDDLDVLDQMQKLTESESHVLKMIRDQIDYLNKVKYVDFNKREY